MKYIIIINKFYGIFDSKELAEKTYNLVQNIESSPFTSIFMLPENDICYFKLSDYKKIDIANYIKVHLSKKLVLKSPNLNSRLYDFKLKKHNGGEWPNFEIGYDIFNEINDDILEYELIRTI
jgi:hypothetical protein